LRLLRKSPAFTAAALLLLALGIGASTAVFSVVEGVLLRPLPYPDSHRLVRLGESFRGETRSVSYQNFLDWKAQQAALEHLGVWRRLSRNLAGDEPLRLPGVQMSGDVFAALQVRPLLGRVWRPDEDAPGAAAVVVLSHALWQSGFAGDPRIVNRAITLDGRSFTVIGVMPPGFAFPTETALLWEPIGPAAAAWTGRAERPGLRAVARLRAGAGLREARAVMDVIARRLAAAHPAANERVGVAVDLLLDSQVGQIRRTLWMLFGAAGLLLSITWANVAGLLLARAVARQQEIAVRAALGATGGRMLRQVLAESLLLSAGGAALALLLAQLGLRLILVVAAGAIPRAEEIRIDGAVLVYCAAVAAATGVLVGLPAAWLGRRRDLHRVLKGRGGGATAGRLPLRQLLVVGQVALTVVLLIAAGLLLGSFRRLHAVNAGYVADGVLSFRLTLPARTYRTQARQIAFHRDLAGRLRALPGVVAASVASQIPLDDSSAESHFVVEGQPEPPMHQRPSLEMSFVGPDYFRVLGIPVLRGRTFREDDDRRRLRGGGEAEGAAGFDVAVIDEELARRHWPGRDPVGQQIRLTWGPRERHPVVTIVGVVGRVALQRLGETGGLGQAYFPFWQHALATTTTVVLKSSVAPDALAAPARAVVRSLDREQPMFDVRTLADMRRRSLGPQRLHLLLVGLFAGVALVLATVGVYGVLAHAALARQREMGVRIALGARAGQVAGLLLRRGLLLAVLGLALGLAAALALGRLLAPLLYGVETTDGPTFAAVTALVALVALAACYLPARHAAALDPMTALRRE
jgi:putative ABC transport system permease protein